MVSHGSRHGRCDVHKLPTHTSSRMTQTKHRKYTHSRRPPPTPAINTLNTTSHSVPQCDNIHAPSIQTQHSQRHGVTNDTCPQRTPGLTADQSRSGSCHSVDSQTVLIACDDSDTTQSHATSYSHSTLTLATTPLATTTCHSHRFSATHVSFDNFPMLSGMLPLSSFAWKWIALHPSKHSHPSSQPVGGRV